MQKFKPGDVVRITKKWLAPYENPDTDYIVLEDLTDEIFKDGRVKITTHSEGRIFPDTSIVSYDMIYKIGHVYIGGN